MISTGPKDAHIPSEVVALLSALHLTKPDTEPLTRLSGEQWASLLEFCDTAHLTLSLAQLSSLPFPSWVARRLQTNLADNALRFESVKATYNEAAEALHKAGVDFIVIKGFTQAPDYVRDPRLRAQSDLDLYCPPEMIERARTALHSLGYQSYKMVSSKAADHDAVLYRPGNRVWRGNEFDPEISLGIELHFCLWNEANTYFAMPGVEDFWHRRTVRTVDGLTFPCLSPIDQLGYLTLHILRNIFLGEWIIHYVYELAVFLHSHSEDNSFWSEWTDKLDPSLQSIEAIAFYFARAWFGCHLHPDAEHAIAGVPAQQQRWLDSFTQSPLEVMFHHNKDFLWLHLTFLNSSKSKIAVIRRTMVPPRIAPIDSPTVKVRNKRLRPTSESNRYWQYVVYLADRSVSHSVASLSTLRRGLQWKFAQYQLARQFWTFLAASFLFDLGLFIYFFLFNLFLLKNGYTEKTLGLIASSMAAGGFTGAIPAGAFARKFGLHAALLTAFLLAVASFSARALLLALPIQLALAFLCGITLSIWAVCISPSVAQMTSERQRPFAFSLVFSLGIGLGALGGFIGGQLPGFLARHPILPFRIDPLRLVLLLSCGVVALGILPVSRLNFTRPDLPRRARPSFLSPFLLRFLPAIAVWSLVTGSFSPFATVYFAQHIHMSLPQIGYAFSLSQIMQVGAVLAAPLLFRRWGLVNGIVFSQLAAATLLCILAAVHSPLAATLGYMSFTAFQWMNEPGLFSLLMDRVYPEQREGAAASNSLVTSGSAALAAMLAGAAFTKFGYPVSMLSIAAIAVIAAVLFWRLVGSQSPQPALELNRITD